MRVFGINPAEYLFVMLPMLIFWLVVLALIGLVLYWVIRKAVCAGMEDFEKKKAEKR